MSTVWTHSKNVSTSADFLDISFPDSRACKRVRNQIAARALQLRKGFVGCNGLPKHPFLPSEPRVGPRYVSAVHQEMDVVGGDRIVEHAQTEPLSGLENPVQSTDNGAGLAENLKETVFHGSGA
jgi:hypothetical protein